MTKKLKITLLLGFFLLAKSNLGLGQSLDLQEYLKQVKDSHPSIKAAKLTAEAQIEKNQDLELMLSPRIKSELSHSYDKKTELMPSGPYPSTDHTQKLEFSWIKSLKNGMNLRISQFFSHTLKDPKGDRPSNSHDFMPLSQIELSVPLLKNRGGREYEWQKKQLEFRIKADQSAEDFKVNSILIEAEAAYWRLALSREQKGTVAASLKRAELIEKIQAKKAKDLLSDEADYLQARGLRENREMDLKSSIEDERQAAFSLNNFRQNTAQEVPESLPSLGPELMGKLILPTKKGERRDLLSMKHQYEALGQSLDLTVEKNADVLDSFVRLDSTAKAGIFPKAVAEDLSLKYPTLTVGLRFTKVLGRESINRQRSGLAKEREALRQLIVRKEFDLERDWNDLDQQLRAARERYKLSLEMIETQTKRLQREKERNQFGRSTIFQVITVEGDLSQAEALRIRALGDMVRIVTKLKAFEVEA